MVERDALLRVVPEERAERLEAYLRNQISRVLGLPPARLERDASLKRMGMDSLMTLELKNRFEADLGVTLSTTQLLNGPTLGELSARLLAQLTPALPDTPPPADGSRYEAPRVDASGVIAEDVSPAGARRLLASVDRLTDAQVAELLQVLEGGGDGR